MSKKKHIDDLLIEVYECEKDLVEKMSNEEKEKLLLEKQKQTIKNKKNPNSFFILKDLPAPKNWEEKTSSKAGLLVILAFVIVMLGFLGLFFGMAFLK